MTFDWSRFEEVPSEKSSFDWAKYEEAPKEVSRTRSLLSAFPKGLIRGGKQLSQLQDPISSAISSFAQNKPDLEEELSQRFLPTQKGQFAEEVLETAGELTPSFAMGPGGFGAKAAQVAGGSLSKNVLKQMGAPELVQDIGAGVGSAIPGGIKAILSKKINPSSAQKEVYEMLKGHGISDKDITPFIQSKKKSDILAKWVKPFINKDRLEKQGKPVSETIYDSIKKKGSALPPLSGAKKASFLKTFEDDLKEVPYFFRDSISKDVERLKTSPLTWDNLRDFELAINNKIKGAEGGKAVLGTLKKSIGLGERMISQDLFNEKQLMNKAYSQQKNLACRNLSKRFWRERAIRRKRR